MTSGSLSPTITYVTDPDLTVGDQKRVIRDLMEAANDFTVRVAIRLPEMPDGEVIQLLEWYWNEAARLNPQAVLRSPLIHYRPGLPGFTKNARPWMPARLIGAGLHASAYSVHNRHEVEHAIRSGAEEVVFGHVFTTESHLHQQGRGIAALHEARAGIGDTPGITFTAIGGINEASMHALGEAGVSSVACMRALSRAPDMVRTLWNMHQEWNRGRNVSLEKGQYQ